MSRLTAVSLFDGIGGFLLAFQRAGAKLVASCEIDPAAASVSKRHFPDVHQFDDVTELTGDDLRAVGFVGERGVITAGWPCQDLSIAGRRAGLEGARSGLWWEVVRLLDETRARWFLGENVPGLLSSNAGRDMGAVLGALGDLGYGFAYRVLDAQFFGVPQRRRRVFFVGHLGEPFSAAAEVLFEPPGRAGDIAASAEAGSTTAAAVRGSSSVLSRSGGGLVPALISRYAKGADSSATDAIVIEDQHTHTHNSFDSAGRRATGIPDRRRISGGQSPHRHGR